MKVVFVDVSDFEEAVMKRFKDEHPEIMIVMYKDDITKVKIEDFDADCLSIFINSRVDKNTLLKFTGLKFIFTRSTGFDHIDLESCGKNNIRVCNVPDYGSQTVAEFTFFLILSLFRKINFSNNNSMKFLRGRELEGKSIGIIGAGKIGNNVGKIANAFGMNILYYSRSSSGYLDSINGRRLELNELLSGSDVVTVHVPLNAATYHMINKDNIKLMKKDAILINTSRGAVVDTDAVVEALDSNAIGGVGLDVIEGEEFSGKEMEIIKRKENYDLIKQALETNILKGFDNAILTPHIAYNTEEALTRIVNSTCENIINAYKGADLKNRII